MGKIAFLFPGQGAQVVGMGRDIYENCDAAKKLLDAANRELDFDLLELMLEGPIEKLSLTEYTQPALVACELMILEALREAKIVPDVVAGLSLGEYSALVAAGAISSLDAIKLVRERGIIMSEALPAGTTTMAAVLGLESDVLSTLCSNASSHGVVEIANYNCPGQIVIGGHNEAVAVVGEKALKIGAKRVINLPVSGAFHTSLLFEAGKKLREKLTEIPMQEMSIPVVFNKTGHYQDAELIDLMEAQISSAVKFQNSIEFMIKEGVDTFIEVGPGRSLSGFVKKVDRKLAVYQVEDLAGIQGLVDILGGKNDE